MIKDLYPDEECPDCGEPIPDSAQEGDACPNCGHVFLLGREGSSMNPIEQLEFLKKTLAKVYIELRVYDGIEEIDRITELVKQAMLECKND